MEVTTIDHVNLRVPTESVAELRAFYERLGFEAEGVEELRSGELPFFDVRLDGDHVIHLWPDEGFSEPTGENYDHVALVVDAPIDEVEAELAAAGVEITDTNEAPKGATGWEPSLYVEDPAGYTVELKQHHRHGAEP
jgi:lactoylglutathione lyase